MRILPLAALSLLAAGAVAGGVALADGGKHHGMGMIDSDGDSKISAQEAASFHAERFAELDSDGDGSITAEEWASLHADRFAEGDSDGDGYLTRQEMKNHWKGKRENSAN